MKKIIKITVVTEKQEDPSVEMYGTYTRGIGKQEDENAHLIETGRDVRCFPYFDACPGTNPQKSFERAEAILDGEIEVFSIVGYAEIEICENQQIISTVPFGHFETGEEVTKTILAIDSIHQMLKEIGFKDEEILPAIREYEKS